MPAAELHVGTSAFTAAGWPGTFYPEGTKSADYLAYYSQHFESVEIDSTFYRIPAIATVRRWYAQTPKGFLFAAKMPQTITHEQVLEGSEAELSRFLKTMDALGDKLGPLLFQFPYFNRQKFATLDSFLERLAPFVKRIPKGYRFAIEIRNKNWLATKFTELLKMRGVALALIDHPWLPRPSELVSKLDPVTADFAYIRWLGDRKGIEERTTSWDKTIVDRRRELGEWVNLCWKLNGRGVAIFAYANNHYAGYAPDTVRLFQELWKKRASKP